VTLIAHAPGEGGDDLGVAQVFFLRHARHLQVFAHEEHGQLGVFGADAVRLAELAGFDGAQLGVIAAAALGDVVEQRREDEHPRRIEVSPPAPSTADIRGHVRA
jgi:hypothetical protein